MRIIWKQRIKETFSADLRSLALLRISLAIIIILDLVNRSKALTAHYTDLGVLPRELIVERVLFSPFHMLFGSTAGVATIFVIQGIFALALLIGWRTRWMTLICLLFNISMGQRNPIVLHQGAMLIRLILFWGLFLPWGARFSIDQALAKNSESSEKSHFSIATIAYLAQVVLLYVSTTLFKIKYPVWQDGQGLWVTLNVDTYARPLGAWLLEFPEALKWMSYGALAFEGIGPLLLFIPFCFGPLRMAIVIGFFYFHLVIWLCLYVGFFQPLSVVLMFFFIPAWFWDGILPKLSTRLKANATLYFDGDCGFCEKSARVIKSFFLLPVTSTRPAQETPEVYKEMQERRSWIFVDSDGNSFYGFDAWIKLCRISPILLPFAPICRLFVGVGENSYRLIADNRNKLSQLTAYIPYRPLQMGLPKWAQLFVLVCLIYMTCSNVSHLLEKPLPVSPSAKTFFNLIRMDQRWAMFSNLRAIPNGWWRFVGISENGDQIDLLSGEPFSPRNPVPDKKLLDNINWRMFWNNLLNSKYEPYREAAGYYYCNQWNLVKKRADPIKRVDAYYADELFDENYRFQDPIVYRLVKVMCKDNPRNLATTAP